MCVAEIIEGRSEPYQKWTNGLCFVNENGVYDVHKVSKNIGPYPMNPKILDPTMCMPPTLL